MGKEGKRRQDGKAKDPRLLAWATTGYDAICQQDANRNSSLEA